SLPRLEPPSLAAEPLTLDFIPPKQRVVRVVDPHIAVVRALQHLRLEAGDVESRGLAVRQVRALGVTAAATAATAPAAAATPVGREGLAVEVLDRLGDRVTNLGVRRNIPRVVRAAQAAQAGVDAQDAIGCVQLGVLCDTRVTCVER